MLRTPEQQPAGDTDRVMLLAMWVKFLLAQHKHKEHKEKEVEQKKPMILAGMGKPTFRINPHVVRAALDYWACLAKQVTCVERQLDKQVREEEHKRRKEVDMSAAVIDYGNPQGEPKARQRMAQALNQWYPSVGFNPEDILFTVGGAGALHIIFKVINEMHPGCRIITPFPHYTLYSAGGKNRLHPIDVMKSPGYKLTAELLEQAILEAIRLGEKDGGMPKAFLFCNPNNPLGTVIDRAEMEKIVEVLRKYPDIVIISDGAYAEMAFSTQNETSKQVTANLHISLLAVAPDLAQRVVFLRSGTKAASAAGVRMAILVTKNSEIMSKCLAKNIEICGHAPIPLQYAFAAALARLDVKEANCLRKHYQPKVELVEKGLERIAATMPDSKYGSEGTFYVLTNLRDLIGVPLPKITQQALGAREVIRTDEDIAYYLLFCHQIMLAPLSYFGHNPKSGFLRITCSVSNELLTQLVERLEVLLVGARKLKQEKILNQLKQVLPKLKEYNAQQAEQLEAEAKQILQIPSEQNANQSQAKVLKQQNILLREIYSKTIVTLRRADQVEKTKAATLIQACYRGHLERRKVKKLREQRDLARYELVDQLLSQLVVKENERGPLRALLNLSVMASPQRLEVMQKALAEVSQPLLATATMSC